MPQRPHRHHDGHQVPRLLGLQPFVIVDRFGLQIELIPHLFGNHRPTGQRGLYMYFRNSSKVIDANAFRALIGIA